MTQRVSHLNLTNGQPIIGFTVISASFQQNNLSIRVHAHLEKCTAFYYLVLSTRYSRASSSTSHRDNMAFVLLHHHWQKCFNCLKTLAGG